MLMRSQEEEKDARERIMRDVPHSKIVFNSDLRIGSGSTVYH